MANAEFFRKRGALEPALVVATQNADATTPDITAVLGVTLRFQLTTSEQEMNIDGTVTDGPASESTHEPQTGDMATVGIWRGEREVEWAAGRVSVDPEYGYITLTVSELAQDLYD